MYTCIRHSVQGWSSSCNHFFFCASWHMEHWLNPSPRCKAEYLGTLHTWVTVNFSITHSQGLGRERESKARKISLVLHREPAIKWMWGGTRQRAGQEQVLVMLAWSTPSQTLPARKTHAIQTIHPSPQGPTVLVRDHKERMLQPPCGQSFSYSLNDMDWACPSVCQAL